ncbi:MAG: hypothetical protein D6731_06515 [Planctomycetota bacterium]|nr:MAG: hypothetical protein D6731_06515 [Planctomycetota bacterium]
MSACPPLSALAGGDETGLRHARGCPRCGELLADLRCLRGRLHALDPTGWAGGPSPGVDTEAALGAVLARADREGLGRRRRRLRRVLHAASTLAAAVLLAGLAAPHLLRQRIEGSPTRGLTASAWDGERSTLFWTTAHGR